MCRPGIANALVASLLVLCSCTSLKRMVVEAKVPMTWLGASRAEVEAAWGPPASTGSGFSIGTNSGSWTTLVYRVEPGQTIVSRDGRSTFTVPADGGVRAYTFVLNSGGRVTRVNTMAGSIGRRAAAPRAEGQ